MNNNKLKDAHDKKVLETLIIRYKPDKISKITLKPFTQEKLDFQGCKEAFIWVDSLGEEA